MIIPFSMSKQDLWIAHFFCLVNAQTGKKLQKIKKILEGDMLRKTTLKNDGKIKSLQNRTQHYRLLTSKFKVFCMMSFDA